MSEEQQLDTSSFVSEEIGGAPEAEAAPAEADTMPEAGATAEDDGEEKPVKAKPSAQERIDEITRARREAEREAAHWRAIAEGKKPNGNGNGAEPEAAKAPDPADYDYGESDPKFIRETIAFEVKKGLDEGRQVLAQELQHQAGERVWEAAQDAARSEFADYDDKVIRGADNWPCTPEMAAAIKQSDAGGKLAYHLASNPDEARRIASFSDGTMAGAFRQVRELGKLEGALGAPKVKAQPTTNAPRPPESQVRGQGGQFSVSPDTDDFAAFERGIADKWKT